MPRAWSGVWSAKSPAATSIEVTAAVDRAATAATFARLLPRALQLDRRIIWPAAERIDGAKEVRSRRLAHSFQLQGLSQIMPALRGQLTRLDQVGPRRFRMPVAVEPLAEAKVGGRHRVAVGRRLDARADFLGR